MTDMAWEKSPKTKNDSPTTQGKNERWKFLLGGALILAAVIFLVITSTVSGARFFITVDEVVSDTTYQGQSVRLSGAVIGDTIDYDFNTGRLTFTIAHIPSEFDDLAETLHLSANDPDATSLVVVMDDAGVPDLLQHEAQAILTGSLSDDGVFHATELNLKCPTRFEEHSPAMLAENQG